MGKVISEPLTPEVIRKANERGFQFRYLALKNLPTRARRY
jgi:hypothetical protein